MYTKVTAGSFVFVVAFRLIYFASHINPRIAYLRQLGGGNGVTDDCWYPHTSKRN